ncbi:MAG: hypothetical protein F6Q13_12460 [Mycobacterium sp.]|nr:MAG: hypothetical protein F6Q13_12460 [Mycobacterium sp.]
MRDRVGWCSRPGYALALTLLVVAPLLGPGYLLVRDAVSTPRSYLSDTALGLAESAPRATPQDFAVALATRVLDGGIVVKVLLVSGLWLAGWGAARLAATVLPEAGPSGQVVAITVATWNPYVAERLLQGHWSLLVGYGCLPWVANTVLTLRSAGGQAGPHYFGLAAWMALAGLTPTGLIMAATVALVCVAAPGDGRPRPLCAAVTLGCAVAAALPWLTAAALTSSSVTHTWAQASGLAAFAARAEPGLGTLGSLASLGGMWNRAAVPTSRSTLFAVLSAAVLLGVVAVGLPSVLRRRPAVPLLVLAAASVLVPAALATGPGLAVLKAGVEVAPGLGLLRDGQKWVALAMPGYALAGAGAVLTVRRWLPAAATALLCCAALVLTLPDLAWGVGGKLRPVRYPVGWRAAAAVINADPGPVAVLPADTMRMFSWSGRAPVLDPLPRWLRADVLTTGDLTVDGVTVPGEGGRARDIQRLLLTGTNPDALARAGVRWLVTERGTPGETGAAEKTVGGLPVVYRGPDLVVYRVGGGSSSAARGSGGRRSAVLTAHLLWLTMLVGGTAGMAVAGLRRRSRRRAGNLPTGA